MNAQVAAALGDCTIELIGTEDRAVVEEATIEDVHNASVSQVYAICWRFGLIVVWLQNVP